MKWRLINTGFNDGAYNMAVDEAIMESVAQGLVPPTLRFYGWKPAAITLGYFQKANKEINIDQCLARGVQIVRRLTGGRAVLHDQELTYSIVIPENYPQIPGTITESYKLLSQGLLKGFAQLGIHADLAPPVRMKPGDFASGACFDAPSSYELAVDGKKIVGSAQVRRQGVILQHGSILNDLDVEQLFTCLQFPNEEVRNRAKRIFSSKATCIRDIKGEPAQWEELCTAFYQGFTQGLGITMDNVQLSQGEVELAEELINKYRSDDWNLKR